MRLNRTNTLAAFWGLAEATVFIIVPDVLLSWIALRSRKRALSACLWATGAALLGGCILWFVARHDPEPARALFAALPAINDEMIESVRSELNAAGLKALFMGPLQGTPYKIYAVEAASIGYGLGIFLLVSLPARLIRFLLVSLVAGGIATVLRQRMSLRHLRTLHVLFWVALYSWYFSAMSGTN